MARPRQTRASVERAAARRRPRPNSIDTEHNTVAEIQGVGVMYRIRLVHPAPLYDVEAMSGPVDHAVLEGVFWEQAMDFVRDEVAEQLAGEGSSGPFSTTR
jgi:hypothetical protein